ncbi:hypothetical protein CEP52_012901 [Fusarium oligoseptatum]|nr:hypothetical protein CEP52_012901 [Fusarium oligoseptatum]RSM01421.1 hypothetical protein CDV31_011354 [Fusarium ambrosium]
MLHRPKAQSVRHRGSISSRYTALQRAETATTSNSRLRSDSNLDAEDEEVVIQHPVEPRARIPMLPPVLNKSIDTHPVCWLDFTEDAIITSCKSGHIRTWLRPGSELAAQTEGASAPAAAS